MRENPTWIARTIFLHASNPHYPYCSSDNTGPCLYQINHAVPVYGHVLLCDHLDCFLSHNPAKERGYIWQVRIWRAFSTTHSSAKSVRKIIAKRNPQLANSLVKLLLR